MENAGAGGLPPGFGMPGGPGGPGGGMPPGMPPGMMMPGGGAPFDMSKIKEMLEDPSIKDMAKQIAEVGGAGRHKCKCATAVRDFDA